MPAEAQADLISLFDAVLPAGLPPTLSGILKRAFGLPRLQQLYCDLASGGNGSIADRLLKRLEIDCRVSPVDLDRIPRQGPVIAVANHPYGILDGAILAALFSSVRPDVRFLANQLLSALPDVRPLVIEVNPFGGAEAARFNRRGMRRALQHLKAGGMLVVFPAGEVSHFTWSRRAIADPEWHSAVASLAEASGAAVAPVFIDGANSALFQAMGTLHPRLRTAMLGRELLNKRHRRVSVRIGAPVPAERLQALPNAAERTQYLRWRTHLLENRAGHKPQTSRPFLPASLRRTPPEPIVDAVSPAALARDVAALAPLLFAGDLDVYLAKAGQIPAVLQEIGRLREITFRAAGEGTGKATDLDRFDAAYLHLFVWNRKACEVAGAYRLAPVDNALTPLYTETLFGYSREFREKLGSAMELGRSFVRPEYQRAFQPLLLLWKGIGRFVAANPQYKILFGPVSISNNYQTVSRELMVSFLRRHAYLSDWAALLRLKNPFRAPKAQAKPAAAPLDLDDLISAVDDIEPGRPGVPVLLRQYLKLGGKLLGFNIDPDFNNALDGLILVDLTQTERRLVERYLGKAEAADFFEFHQRNQNS
jgi:putative hemolysin